MTETTPETVLRSCVDQVMHELIEEFVGIKCRRFEGSPEGTMQIDCIKLGRNPEHGLRHRFATHTATAEIAMWGPKNWINLQKETIETAFKRGGSPLERKNT